MANPVGYNDMVVLTDDQIIEVKALAAYLSIEQMADHFGISRTTFYTIMERQPVVAVQYKSGKAAAITDMATSLIMQARAGSAAAAMFYLKCNAGWKETNTVEHTGSLDLKEIRMVVVDSK